MLKCKVFSATLARERNELGNLVSEFITPKGVVVVDLCKGQVLS